MNTCSTFKKSCKAILLCFVLFFATAFNTALYSQCTSNATSTADEDIFNVTFGTLNNSSTCASTAPGPGSVTRKYANYTALAAPNVVQCSNVPFSVQIGTCGTTNYKNAVAIYIDWNADNDFTDAGENVYLSAASTLGPHTETGTITIPGSALIGNKRMRVVNVETNNPLIISSCGTYSYGETEDYTINVTAGASLSYTSSTCAQLVTGSVEQCITNKQIARVEVVMGAGCAGILTQFQLGAGSSTNLLADVSKIRIYCTGTVNTFSPVNEFVSGGTVPVGTTNTINGAQGLVNGTNYFWICYDMNPGSTIGNIIDGSCTQIRIDGVDRVPSVTNPIGNGVISTCVIPGGVLGSTVWYKANGNLYSDAGATPSVDGSTVYRWNDNGKTGLHLEQSDAARRPTFSKYGSNYNPWVKFDPSLNTVIYRSNCLFSDIYNPVSNSVFLVNKHNSGVVWTKWENFTDRVMFEAQGDAVRFDFPNLNAPNQAIGTTPITGRSVIIAGTTGTLASAQNTIYLDSKLEIAMNRGTATHPGGTGNFYLGASDLIENWESDCEISEYLVFPSLLSTTDRVKVESYMAVKYGITLSNFGGGVQGDYLATNNSLIWDASINPLYHNNVIGIGRDDTEELYQKQSHQIDDTVRIYLNTLAASNIENSGTFSSDISYVVQGSDNRKLCATAAAIGEMPTGLTNCTLYSRLEREWKVTRTNMADIYNMDVKLNACAIPGSVNVAHLRFLVDDDGDFANGGTQCYYNGDGTGIVITYSNPTITISNISTTHIPNNGIKYITIASIDVVTPLPIELLFFDAKLNDKETVDLTWETESERNNDYFMIEKSTDGINWELLGNVDGSGTTSSPISYYLEDKNPLFGVNYYKLSQIDFDGVKIEEGIRSVALVSNDAFILSPNPANNLVIIYGEDLDKTKIEIYNNLGQKVQVDSTLFDSTRIELNTNNLASGIYFVSLSNENKSIVIKLLIEK